MIICLCAAVLIAAGLIWSWPYRQAERMIDAIRRDDMAAVEQMLDAGVSPNQSTAPINGLWKYLNRLVESSPVYPLPVACYSGNLEMVQLLLDHGAEPALTEQENTDWSALSSAVLGSKHEDCVEIIRLLIAHGANPEDRKDYYLPVELASMEYPLDDAHAERIVELVQLLMVDAADKDDLLENAKLWENEPLKAYLQSLGTE